jgi:hypothetical protein
MITTGNFTGNVNDIVAVIQNPMALIINTGIKFEISEP